VDQEFVADNSASFPLASASQTVGSVDNDMSAVTARRHVDVSRATAHGRHRKIPSPAAAPHFDAELVANAALPAALPGLYHIDAATEATSNQAFLRTVQNLDVDAAIIVFERSRPVLRRHAYIIGFNKLQQDSVLTAQMLATLERGWSMLGESDFVSMNLATLQSLMPSGSDAHPCGNRVEIDKQIHLPDAASILKDFEYFAYSVFRGNADSVFRTVLLNRRDRGPFSEHLKYAMHLVQPGLAEIAETQMEVQRAQRRVGIFEGMLDSMSHGIFLLDHDARPFYCNDIARSLMNDTGALLIGSDQILRCRSAEQTRLLHQLIKTSISCKQFSDETIIKLPCNDGGQILGFLIPAVGRDDAPLNRASILMIHRLKVHNASSALMRSFGLLKSEERFLTKFLEAPSLSETASQLNLSEETARTYLKRICAKLGVRRQIELASVMFSLTPPLRRMHENRDLIHV
jgi:PAS domain-containing protein